MLRIEDPEIVATLQEDFLSTWQGRHVSGEWSFDGLELQILDGPSNPDRFERVLELIECARERIYVEGPALTQPFVDPLLAARRRGVAVTVMTPRDNNWGVIEDYMRWLAATSDLEIRFYQGRLTHLKAMLVDDRWLVMGSANLDPWSYWFQQEYLAVVTDPEVLRDFRERVIASGLQGSIAATRGAPGIMERLARPQLRVLEALSLVLNGRWEGRRRRLGWRRLPIEAGRSTQPVAEAQNEASGD
jgi:cardiolipin synthase